ncbi:MAG TPA: hypothetical protein VJL84_09355 [Kiloniellales bacterium]|nr:hypothetical protein [Kiloniellales bacterium]
MVAAMRDPNNPWSRILREGFEWLAGGTGGHIFSPVTLDGMNVDRCLTFGQKCDQPAADEFCRLKGFQHATYFEWEYMYPTMTLQSLEICNHPDSCGGFTKIVCE